MHRHNAITITLFYLCGITLLSACAHSTKQNTTHPGVETDTVSSVDISRLHTGQQIAALAKSQIGKPYRYSGATPMGFDCSGLVYYTHGKLGIAIPRTSQQQNKSARPVKFHELKAGDVVFFKLNSKKISHVGIYIGQGQFVHAPSNGKQVVANYLNDTFWQSRIVSSGRLY